MAGAWFATRASPTRKPIMPNDYMDDEDSGSTTGTMRAEKPSKPKDEYGETALIPKRLLAGKEFKPGEEIVLEIVKLHGEEVEVRYASEHKEPHDDATEPKDNPGYDAMME